MNLKTTKVEATTLKEVSESISNPAGLKELEYVLAHPDEFPEMKDDNYYFFFGAAAGKRVPCLFWFGVRFCRYSFLLKRGWRSYDRAVLRDSELDSSESLSLEDLLLDLGDLFEEFSAKGDALIKKYKK